MASDVSTNILIQYLSWRFFDVPRNLLRAWKNFLIFNLNFFSTTLLLKTFFSPWRQYKWSYGRGFDLGRYFEILVSNLISRILGAIMRIFLIAISLFVEVIIIFAGIVIFFIWLVLPIILILGFYHGFRILF